MNCALSGKVIVVTGASGGIGSAIARQFAAEGSKLVLHYRSQLSAARSLQSDLKGVESILVRADLTKESEVKRLIQQAVKQFGRIDTLIANAGSWENRDIPMHEMTL